MNDQIEGLKAQVTELKAQVAQMAADIHALREYNPDFIWTPGSRQLAIHRELRGIQQRLQYLEKSHNALGSSK